MSSWNARVAPIALLTLAVAGCLYRSTPPPDGSALAAVPAPSGIEVVAQACANCHVLDGLDGNGIPLISGRSEAVLAAQLRAFKLDQAPGATVMPRLMKGFADEELDELARYFASLQASADGR